LRSGRWAGSRRAADLPKDWKKRHDYILARDPICMLRTHCHGALSEEVDHIGQRTDHRLHMLRGACTPCHTHRTQAQAQAARGAGPTRRRPVEQHPGIRPRGGV
jgi:5-methylcytosine-specific restriction protein A